MKIISFFICFSLAVLLGFSVYIACRKPKTHFGFIDKKGRFVIPCKYQSASSFRDGFAQVKKNGKLFFIDNMGKKHDDVLPKIKCPIESATLLIGENYRLEGLVKILINDKIGFADLDGGIIIEPKYKWVSGFKEGFCVVEENGKFSYIDKTGQSVFGQQFDLATKFSEGLALVTKDKRDFFIDPTGKEVFEVSQFSHPFLHEDSEVSQLPYVSLFNEGFALCTKENGRKVFLNKEGVIAFESEFEDAHLFSEGLAAVKLNNRWGYLDTKGKIAIQTNFSYVCNFSEGMAAVYMKGKYGYINTQGEIIIQPQFDYVTDFSEGLAAVGIWK